MMRELGPATTIPGTLGASDRLTFVGHSTVLLELGGTRLLTDPLLRNRLGHLRRHGPPPDRAVARRLDAVLLSHVHRDHADVPSLRMLDPGVRVVSAPGAARVLRRAGLEDVVELEPGASTRVGAVEVTATRAVHGGPRNPLGRAAAAIGFDLRAGRRVYFAGDTDLFPEMAALAGLDLALLPVWGWGPTLGPGHLDPERAAEAAALVRPRVCVPIHWGTFYPRGLERRRPEPLREPPLRFAARVAELAPEVEVRVLEPGASTPL
jgi:L-ascorbate metabolism protein UlaG (beta-lactamase superfamily)